MKFRSTPLPACRNGVLFDNSLNDKRFRIDIRMENGYEKGCTWGATAFLSFRDNDGARRHVCLASESYGRIACGGSLRCSA